MNRCNIMVDIITPSETFSNSGDVSNMDQSIGDSLQCVSIFYQALEFEIMKKVFKIYFGCDQIQWKNNSISFSLSQDHVNFYWPSCALSCASAMKISTSYTSFNQSNTANLKIEAVFIGWKQCRRSKLPSHWCTPVRQKVGSNLNGIGFRL